MWLIPDTFLTVSQQSALFLWSALLGVPLGLLVILLHAVRKAFSLPAWAASFGDVIFCILWAAVNVCFTSAAADGQFRLYYLLGNLFGGGLVLLIAGYPLYRLFYAVFYRFRKLLAVVLQPFSRLVAMFQRKCNRKFVLISKNYGKRKNVVHHPLIAVQKMLYNVISSLKGKSGE